MSSAQRNRPKIPLFLYKVVAQLRLSFECELFSLRWSDVDLVNRIIRIADSKNGTRRDILEILDDRYGRRSTIVTSQYPVKKWHEYIGDPTIADSILDRLVHNAHRMELTGRTMRGEMVKGKDTRTTATDKEARK